ncbi:MAG TPA: hypothetical protein VFA78_03135 [Chloroflexota bacterium]|nr:hypothetical protein [Chloroflexota bacterium]
MTRVRIRPLAAPKRGSAPDEYEDAYWPRRALVREEVRCAVADGATESSFSGAWARLLVDAYRRGVLDDELTALPHLQRRWQERVDAIPLPWYAEEKARMGAFSSLLGVTIRNGRWEAVAIGDSCLFHGRAGDVLTAFPVTESTELTAAPHLVSSKSSRNATLRDHIRHADAPLEIGDILYLATDALAGWILRRIEAGLPLTELATLHPATFAAWLATERDNLTIRNDDTTLIRIDVL